MHIVSLLKLLLFILRKAQNFSTLVALRFTTGLRRYVLALNCSGAAKNFVWFWYWIVSRDRKSNLPVERSDTTCSHPSQPHFQAENPPDHITCASVPNHDSRVLPNAPHNEVWPPSNTVSSDVAEAPPHLNGAGGSFSNEDIVPSSIQEQSDLLNAGAAEITVGGGNDLITVNSPSPPSELKTEDLGKNLVLTTPSYRKRYDRGISMCVINFNLSL